MLFPTNWPFVLCLCQVCSDGPSSRFTAGKWGTWPSSIVDKKRSPVAEPNHNCYEQIQEQFQYKCADCGLVFKEKNQMIRHVRSRHAGKRLACPQCQCTFVTRAGLVEHVKHIHQKLSRYTCQTCGKGYSIRSQYFDHLAAHTGVKRNVCTICQTRFTYKHGLKAHVLRFHPNEAEQT